MNKLDHRYRLLKIRDELDDETMRKIDQALKRIFDLERGNRRGASVLRSHTWT